MRDGQNQSAYSPSGKRSAVLGHKVIFSQKLTAQRLVSFSSALRICSVSKSVKAKGSPPEIWPFRFFRSYYIMLFFALQEVSEKNTFFLHPKKAKRRCRNPIFPRFPGSPVPLSALLYLHDIKILVNCTMQRKKRGDSVSKIEIFSLLLTSG